jgi:predicted pyridoxine 5'-phosphate oxidase superfamily flavin-nucleotide-binding protein
MAHALGSLLFTPVVQALQERHGSRRQYARMAASPGPTAPLGSDEAALIAERDSFYMASVGETGWPYVQHRGGPAGFLKVIDPQTIAFADFGGNKQFISAGNLSRDERVAIILVDYPAQSRLKILGHVRTIEGAAMADWLPAVQDPAYKATIERVFVVHVDARTGTARSTSRRATRLPTFERRWHRSRIECGISPTRTNRCDGSSPRSGHPTR